MYPNIELDYSSWLEVRADLSTVTYYIEYGYEYIPFVIDTTNRIVYRTGVQRYAPASSNVLLAGTKSSKTIQDIFYQANSYGATAARGSATVSGFGSLAGATLTVNGVVLTEGMEWTAAVSNDATATSLANAITTATATTLATGSANGAVVTITANTAGAAGNSISLASSDGTHLPVSGVFLTGGADGVNGDSITIQYVDTSAAATGTATVVDYTKLSDVVFTINGVKLTEGIDWTAATNNNTTAASLASAISTATASTLCTASAVATNVVTITANTAGVPGNYISLNTSDTVDLTLSGSHLTGGEGGAGFEYVVVTGPAIVVHITSGVSTAQQVVTAVVGWNAYNSLISNSAASAALVSAIVSGASGNPQTIQGPTNLMGGVNPVTTLSDFETNVKSTATQVASIDQAIGISI